MAVRPCSKPTELDEGTPHVPMPIAAYTGQPSGMRTTDADAPTRLLGVDDPAQSSTQDGSALAPLKNLATTASPRSENGARRRYSTPPVATNPVPTYPKPRVSWLMNPAESVGKKWRVCAPAALQREMVIPSAARDLDRGEIIPPRPRSLAALGMTTCTRRERCVRVRIVFEASARE